MDPKLVPPRCATKVKVVMTPKMIGGNSVVTWRILIATTRATQNPQVPADQSVRIRTRVDGLAAGQQCVSER